MGLLKDLDCLLAGFLEATNQDTNPCFSQLYEEFLCCCERARHAIKDFTNQEDDGNVSDCFLVAGDALRDLQWSLPPDPIYRFSDPIDRIRALIALLFPGEKQSFWRRIFDKRVLFPLPRTSNKQGRCSDARNGSGSAHLPPGLNIDDLGEIEYVRDLGEGSEGLVYEAKWGCQHVAVKEVSPGTQSEALVRSSCDSVSRSNVYCELDVLKTLNHPNIVELMGYTRKVRAEGKYGLVMELMEGSLEDLIKSEKLSDLAKVDTLLQVARGMHFLHTVGIMHRDLKPANILIRQLNYLPPIAKRLSYVVAKLADFGLSKGLSKQEDLVVDRAGWHTCKKGTTFYMAPELLKSRNDEDSWYAMSADVFSFGTTCFYVLTGEETPFAQKGHPLECDEFYRMIKKGRLDLFNIESNMAFLVRQCWCFDPRKRPTFHKICKILEDEKRRIICLSLLMSPMSRQVSPTT